MLMCVVTVVVQLCSPLDQAVIQRCNQQPATVCEVTMRDDDRTTYYVEIKSAE